MRCSPFVPVLGPLAGCLACLLIALPAGAADHSRSPTIVDTTAAGAAPERTAPCRLRVIADDGDPDTLELDLSGVGAAIRAGMQGLSSTLAELDAIQVGSERHGRRFIIRGDGHESVIDVDAIMDEVDRALSHACRELGDHADSARHGGAARDHRQARAEIRRAVREERDASRAELRAEIAGLRRELAALQAELRAGR